MKEKDILEEFAEMFQDIYDEVLAEKNSRIPPTEPASHDIEDVPKESDEAEE